jgi:endonuclease III-like uncharacterized protein
MEECPAGFYKQKKNYLYKTLQQVQELFKEILPEGKGKAE